MGEENILLPGLEGFVYKGPTYLELGEKLKSNPLVYNLIQQNIARRNNPTKEIVSYKDANGNTQHTTNVSAGVLSPVDPLAEFYVAGKVVDPLLKGIRTLEQYGLLTTYRYFPKLSYLLNKHKILNNLLGIKIGEGSESNVFKKGSRVYKVSQEGSKNIFDVHRYMQSRLRRNEGPYSLKESIEGIVLKDGKYYPVTSLKYYEPKKQFLPSKESLDILDRLMGKKGYYRVPIEDIPELPGASVIANGKPMYSASAAFRTFVPKSSNYSQVFSNGKNYIIDNRLGTNSILTKNWTGKYKLVLRDNDVIPLFGKSKGYFPLGDKTFNSNILDNTFAPELMEFFKKMFILRWKL